MIRNQGRYHIFDRRKQTDSVQEAETLRYLLLISNCTLIFRWCLKLNIFHTVFRAYEDSLELMKDRLMALAAKTFGRMFKGMRAAYSKICQNNQINTSQDKVHMSFIFLIHLFFILKMWLVFQEAKNNSTIHGTIHGMF